MYTGEKNIIYKDGHYTLRIRRHNVKYVNTFNTLEDAVHARDAIFGSMMPIWVKASKELEVLCRAI
jgi:hypothetical protein